MAQRIITQLIDDVDGQEAAETVSFSLDGIAYEIDLSETHAEALRNALAPFMENGRKVSTKSARARSGGSPRATGKPAAKEVRTWAIENGYEVPERGRLPRQVMQAFEAEH